MVKRPERTTKRGREADRDDISTNTSLPSRRYIVLQSTVTLVSLIIAFWAIGDLLSKGPLFGDVVVKISTSGPTLRPTTSTFIANQPTVAPILAPLTIRPTTSSPITNQPTFTPTLAPMTASPSSFTLRTENPPLPPPQETFDRNDSLLSTRTMLQRLRTKRAEYHDQVLVPAYGDELYQYIFQPELSRDRRYFTGPSLLIETADDPSPEATPPPTDFDPTLSSLGWKRMVQKYQMKLIAVQLSILEDVLQHPHGNARSDRNAP